MQLRLVATALTVCAGLAGGAAMAAVTEDSFLLRNTGDLVDLCTAPQSDRMYTAAANFCQGFAVGAFRVLHAQDMARRSNRLFCAPNPQPTRNEALASFVQWVQADAGRRTMPAVDGVAAFLAAQYPCPRGR